MQAIRVKRLPSTDRLGARWVATAGAGRIVISDGVILDCDNKPRFCAEAFAKNFGWGYGELLQGTLPNGDEVFVFDHPLSRR